LAQIEAPEQRPPVLDRHAVRPDEALGAASFIDEPIRAEIFGVERFEQHAESLAAAQVVSESTRGRPLTPRVLDNGRVLLQCYRTIALAIRRKQSITPAAEWLVDNFHVVDEQIREIRDDLPAGFYRQLPKLASGHLQGCPRVYGVAWAFVAHTDSRFDPELLRRFVTAYQRVQPLTIGELWAVAITLRMVLVENLRRIAERIISNRAAREQADALADSLLSEDEGATARAGAALELLARTPLATAFVVQLIQRLRDLDPKVLPMLHWLDQRLAAEGTTADEVVRAEHQRQAGSSVTVRNIITSMRLMSAFDWSDFFESVSLVDTVLTDGSDFGSMDFATRDRYRHAIEELARGSKHTELEVARRAVANAARARHATNGDAPPDPVRRGDPGYWLISRGRAAFERELGFRISVGGAMLRAYVSAAVPGYLGTIVLGTAAIIAVPLLRSVDEGMASANLVLFGLLAAVPASDLAISLLHHVVTQVLGPRPLPRLELREGVPKELRTLVVMPTLLTERATIEEQVERLEVHFLANPDGELHFALLSDWADAWSESLPSDQELLSIAAGGIARLNERHGPAPGGGERFLLYHRRRTWNERERKWMGWERKRGKLRELNHLLRGSVDTTFVPVDGRPPQAVPDVRYVITLDADTRLPRGAAIRLIGTMAHPLNQPRFDERNGCVVEGYAIVQPRITPALPTDHEGSLFQKAFSGPCGMDPYASAVSDVYQDLFQEGSYTGKGIYQIDAFEAALGRRVPENAMLSHDLFEGILARAALASDVELFEEYPAHFEAAAARQHRWARGDWQLLPWILWRTESAAGARTPSVISVIGRWKMLDNLRRSLSAPAALLTLIAGWFLAPDLAMVWTGFVLTTIAVPSLLAFMAGLEPRRSGISLRSHFRGVLSDLAIGASQFALSVTFLAHQSWLMLDAILRTLVRLFITRRSLLEWVTAAQSTYAGEFDLAGFYRRMAGGVALGAAAGVALILWRPLAWPVAAPLIALWSVAPAIARWISLPPRAAGTARITPSDRRVLRATARRTWGFFETFVTAEDHWLPPDNFQEDPAPVVAHRTSPTNLGLYLLSTLAARDFGWIGTLEAVDRLEATQASMGRLELYRGHFYNWYDTRELRPLEPRYISTVDSGNLAGHLLVLMQTCREILNAPFAGTRVFDGVEDALLLLRAARAEAPRTRGPLRAQLRRAIDALTALFATSPTDAAGWTERFVELRARVGVVSDLATMLSLERGDPPGSELQRWAEAARACIESQARDAAMFIPVLRLDPETRASLGTGPPPVLEGWAAIEPLLRTAPSLTDAPERFGAVARELDAIRSELQRNEPANRREIGWIDALTESLRRSAGEATTLIRRLTAIAQTAENTFQATDFTFLFERTRKLFSIGYRLIDGTLDPGFYDLLASEARLTSFIAIAKGDVPSPHWFHLGRALTPVSHGSALISWSGSMFEYLMPELVMRSPAGSLLRQTCERVVRRQIEYGAERGVPWGVSESAYNVRDLHLTYQYSNFGVPGLGLQRGLSEAIVIAPYATVLAAMLDPVAATANLARITAIGGRGIYGFYESLDFTETRLPPEMDVAIVRAYMAHHQGMTVLSLANVLHEGAMRTRFHAEPIVKATELLLQERTPRDVLVARPRVEEVSTAGHVRELMAPVLRRFTTPHEAVPRTHLLSNGRYTVMLTAAGSGYSRWGDLAVTRWREDSTRDCWGSYVFLRDARTGRVWSAGYQPTCVAADAYEASFSEDHAEIVRRDRGIITTLEVVVSPEDDAEVRRVSVTNLDMRTRDIEVTSYAELCLSPQAADLAHAAFTNLFVQTEFVPEHCALLATRRRRSMADAEVWAAHLAIVEGETCADLQYETDRERFLGRGHGVRDPIAMNDGRPLSNSVGSVLDPMMSLRCTLRIPAGGTARVVFSTMVASSRAQVLELAEKYRDARVFERTMARAWTQAQVQLHHLGIRPDEANVFQRLANGLIYSDPSLRPSSDLLARNTLPVSALWAHGISGDRPIVLARIDDAEDIEIIRQLLRAHEYWRIKGLWADVVIINEHPPSYAQELQNSLAALVRGSQLRLSADSSGVRGNLFLLRADLISEEERVLLQTVARAVLLSRRGTLFEQVFRSQRTEAPAAPAAIPARLEKRQGKPAPAPDLEFFNGLGGFADHGREYVIALADGGRTPRPWINVVANPAFGFLASESGSGFTWSLNSHENRLTPWSNDPVSDPAGEALYLRDEETGEVWTPTALPIRDESASYVARHGQGYSRFRHSSRGIVLDLLQFVPAEDPIKVSRLVVDNRSNRSRRISVTAYVEWVLGASRGDPTPHVITAIDPQTGALFAKSSWGGEFGGRIAFADLAGRQTSWTGDRTEFLGRNGDPARPRALEGGLRLSGRVGAGLDSCAALQTTLELRSGARAEIVFFLGQTENPERARELLQRYRAANLDEVVRDVVDRWDDLLGTVQVTTPEPSMNLLLNRWLLYQTLSCRIWARAGFYQAGGAYGFRDQLQDVMALSVARPALTREHLLRAAARQFVEGDVQHWWHPPSGRGVRTRISDDLLWLPYAVSRFLEASGDHSVLEEVVPFLEGDVLAEGQDESYFQPRLSQTRETLFEHCARALDRSLAVGSHGLPLMGTGDWNDGMNRVGREGQGESVWLGWFLHQNLHEFAKLASARGEHERALRWQSHMDQLALALEREAWDGEWYRRAYFDDGTPLGSSQNDECRIDSIAQSWGVLSGVADPGHAALAMGAVDRLLVRRAERMILLFTPPFDRTPLDPGYIKGYVPGIRENGGQYTHAAVWTVLAFARLQDGNRAGELFQMLNPITHTATAADVERYGAEPYAVAADVYAEPPHVGRGGWTWYTGAAGWLYRAGIESILGLHVHGARLDVDPCIPSAWPSYAIRLRFRSATYEIRVENPDRVSRGVVRAELDGKALASGRDIPLADEAAVHQVLIVLGRS
jgi:cyclic beta-1,2-glucan synthetase